MTKQIIVLAMLVSVALTSYAYAETSTVEVPFDSHGQSCWFDELAVEYHCTWQGIVDSITLEELEEFEGLIADNIYQQAIDDIESEALKQIEIEKAVTPELTPDERLIEEIQRKISKGLAKTSDIVLLSMLEELDQCYQGVGRSAPIQQERSFEISTSKLGLNNNVSIDNRLGKISKAIQECYGQEKLENEILSEKYTNIITTKNDITYDHYGSLAGIQAVPFEKLTSTHRGIDESAICDNHQFSDQHKKQFGCLQEEYDGFYLEKSSGIMEYQSDVLDRFNSFMSQYGNRDVTVQDKQLEAEKSEIIVEELLSENTWYNRE